MEEWIHEELVRWTYSTYYGRENGESGDGSLVKYKTVTHKHIDLRSEVFRLPEQNEWGTYESRVVIIDTVFNYSSV